MSGISIDNIHIQVRKKIPVVRIMPKLALAHGQSVTSFASYGDHEYKEHVLAELRQMGLLIALPEEHFDLFTAIFGSGPAFIL